MADKPIIDDDLLLRKGLPSDVEIERLCLGSVTLDSDKWDILAKELTETDFSLDKHRRIYARMAAIIARGDRVDKITLAHELIREGQLESVDGMTYLSSLDEGLPEIPNLGSYVKILKDKAHLRRVIFTSQRAIARALEANDSAIDIAAEAAESLDVIQAGQRPQEAEKTIIEIVDSYPGGANAFLDPNSRAKGLPSGLSRLDEMTAGFHTGELIVIAARPSMGKTALALNIAQHLSLDDRQRRFGCFFSLEMTADALISRMACAAARVDAHKFRSGYLNADERRRLQGSLVDLTECRLTINDTFGISMREVARHVKRMKKEGGLHFVMVDYLQLMGGAKGENRNLEVGAMTREMKMLAGECQLPFFVLSQLSRSNEKRPGSKVPMLSDLRDSGSIEQDADVVIFIHREEVYKKDDETLRGLADLVLAKQRHGPVGTIGVRFLKGYTKFENKIDDLPFEES